MSFQPAYEAALRLLSRGDKFESEVRAALRDYTPETVDAVIARLVEKRVLDDRRTVTSYVAAHADLSGAMAAERLAQRGAPEGLVEELRQSPSDIHDLQQLLSRRYRRDADNRNKAARYLLRRGFEQEDVETALERYFASSIEEGQVEP